MTPERNTILVAVLLGLLASTASAGRADITYNVNTIADLIDSDTDDGACLTSAGTCSLRAAVMQANQLSGPGTVRIVLPAGTYTLTRPISGANGETNGDLNLTAPNSASQFVAIEGTNPASTIIDGNELDGVMTIDPGRNVMISTVTIRNGRRLGTRSGGGILNTGSLLLVDSVISDNFTSNGGGGIYSDNLLYVVRSTIASNVAQRNGGGIHSSGFLEVYDSTVRANLARQNFGQGGGFYLGGPATIRRSSFFLNAANNGAGILAAGQLTLVNSTLSFKRADTNGGGIYNFSNTFLYSTSVIGNVADHDDDGVGTGGGVYTDATAGHRLVAANTLVASNTIRNLQIFSDCAGTLEVYGFNRLSNLSGCVFTGNGPGAVGLVSRDTIDGIDANGGPTWTNALLPGSEAIDSTTAQGCVDETGAQLATDQRGAARVAGLRCDVGAFEFASVIDRIFHNGFD